MLASALCVLVKHRKSSCVIKEEYPDPCIWCVRDHVAPVPKDAASSLAIPKRSHNAGYDVVQMELVDLPNIKPQVIARDFRKMCVEKPFGNTDKRWRDLGLWNGDVRRAE